MAFSIYNAFVPGCQQMLTALSGMIDKGEAHAREHDLDDAELFEARLHETQWNLPWHVRAVWMHAAYTFEQMKGGEFTPDLSDIPDSWDAMRAMVADAQARIERVSREEVEALADQTIGFVLNGQRVMELTGANFMLSLNQPNVYFHVATFYDILRHKDVPLTKMDFMGPVRAGV